MADLLGIHASNSNKYRSVLNLPVKLINNLGIFRQRFLSCKIESYLSYLQLNIKNILNSQGFHISVHLWLLCPLCNFADLSQTLLLATSGENGIQRQTTLCNFLPFYRTLTLCWFTTWMYPTQTTTRCWWPTLWRSGVRRRSGPRRSSPRNWSQCVSVGITIIPSLFPPKLN